VFPNVVRADLRPKCRSCERRWVGREAYHPIPARSDRDLGQPTSGLGVGWRSTADCRCMTDFSVEAGVIAVGGLLGWHLGRGGIDPTGRPGPAGLGRDCLKCTPQRALDRLVRPPGRGGASRESRPEREMAESCPFRKPSSGLQPGKPDLTLPRRSLETISPPQWGRRGGAGGSPVAGSTFRHLPIRREVCDESGGFGPRATPPPHEPAFTNGDTGRSEADSSSMSRHVGRWRNRGWVDRGRRAMAGRSTDEARRHGPGAAYVAGVAGFPVCRAA
jgi:hypothetical protein